MPAAPAVLVVDGNANVREFCRRELERSGYRVYLAGSDDEALQALARRSPDVVVIEPLARRIDGLGLVQRFADAAPDLPVIIHQTRGAFLRDPRFRLARAVVEKAEDLAQLKSALAAVLARRREVDALARTRQERVFQPVHFDHGRYDVRADQQPRLRQHAERLKADPGLRLLLEGHCDGRGTARYNLGLGARRAESAKQFLVGEGVQAERLTTVSRGHQRPADPGAGEAAWSRNRRVEFVVVEPAA